MHHDITFEAWSRGDQALLLEVPVMYLTGLWSPHSWSVGYGPCARRHRHGYASTDAYSALPVYAKEKSMCICDICMAMVVEML